MAYPILTDIFRCQVVMQGLSGLPEDQFVNNWYFRNDEFPSDLTQITGRIQRVLDAFYAQINGTATQPLNDFLWLFQSVTYKVYDLGQPPPRYPVEPMLDASWLGSEPSSKMPGEVASCLSFKGGPGPRQRGRVYLGPLAQSAMDVDAGRPRPRATFRTAALEGAVNILNSTENLTWVVASPTGASTTVVTEAWMDDALDTQRSRGTSPTARTRADASGILAV